MVYTVAVHLWMVVQVVIKLDHMMSQRPMTKTKKKLKVSEARRIWEEEAVLPACSDIV